MTERKWALDKSALDRSLLSDLSALIGVFNYLDRNPLGDGNKTLQKVRADIDALIGELWPTG